MTPQHHGSSDDQARMGLDESVSMLPPDQQRAVREWTSWSEDLRGESDRGAALVVAAYLDTWLERLLAAAIIDDPLFKEMTQGANGPLASFSAKINMCFLFALIGKEDARQLHLVRRIRNEFAHSFEGTTFESPSVRSRCAELIVPFKMALPPDFGPRHTFELCAFQAFGLLMGLTRAVKRIEWLPLVSGDLAFASEDGAKEWGQRILSIQRGESPSPRSWYGE